MIPPVAPAIRQSALDAAVLRRVTGHSAERMIAAPGSATMKTPIHVATAIIANHADPIGRWMVSIASQVVRKRATTVAPSIAALKTAMEC
jgi:hypothetical protein